MLSFINANLCPGGKTVWEGPAVDREADATQGGYTGSSGLQRVEGSKLGAPSREGGGVIVIGGGMGLMMFGDGERFHPGENEGWEEGSYRSNESTGEKTWG